MNNMLLQYKVDKSANKSGYTNVYSLSLAVLLMSLVMSLSTAQMPEFTDEYGSYGAQAVEKDRTDQGSYGDYGDFEDFSEQAYADVPTDLADEPTGNWYEKLRSLKSAKAQYDELNKILVSIKEQEGTFGAQLKTIQEQIKNFYASVRINPQVLHTTLDALLAELKPVQERVPITEEERLELVEAADKQKALEQLRQEFDLLKSVYADLEKAYTKDSAAQLRQAEEYQERALDSFGRIEKTRSHEKAHELYKIVENSKENIVSIGQYLQNLQNYGVQANAKIQQLMGRIQASIDQLEKQGISVRYVTDQEKAQLLATQQEQQEQERMSKERRTREKAERDRWTGLAWYQKFFEYVQKAGVWVLSQFKRSQ